MAAGASAAFALIRVARGAARPSEDHLRAALQADRERLREAAPPAPTEIQVAGPYHITVAGTDLDEYVVWER
jgi:hypothetical protein